MEKNSDWFRARVVEVHKRYAFVSPQDDAGDVNTRDVWLGTVARKYLQSRRTERNSVAVGDIVYCRPTDRDVDVGTDIPCCVIVNAAPSCRDLSRDPTSQERQHVLAANVDQLLIIAVTKALWSNEANRLSCARRGARDHTHYHSQQRGPFKKKVPSFRRSAKKKSKPIGAGLQSL